MIDRSYNVLQGHIARILAERAITWGMYKPQKEKRALHYYNSYQQGLLLLKNDEAADRMAAELKGTGHLGNAPLTGESLRLIGHGIKSAPKGFAEALITVGSIGDEFKKEKIARAVKHEREDLKYPEGKLQAVFSEIKMHLREKYTIRGGVLGTGRWIYLSPEEFSEKVKCLRRYCEEIGLFNSEDGSASRDFVDKKLKKAQKIYDSFQAESKAPLAGFTR